MPDIEGDGYCIDCLKKIGIAVNGFNSLQPLPWTEINAWKQATNSNLSGWEMETIKLLSDAYVSQYLISDDEFCPSPYNPKLTVEQKKKHAKWLRSQLRK